MLMLLMDMLNVDSLIKIFQQLDFAEKVRLERVCRQWLHILRNPAVHVKMQSLNIVDYIRENRDFLDEKKDPPLLEQTLAGVLDRAGAHIKQLDFDHKWPHIPPGIVQKIAEKCHQLTRLEMGWVRLGADISPILEKVAERLVEFSLEESTWANDEDAQKVSNFFARMRNLKRLNLRKFGQPLELLAKLEGGQLEFLDVSEASQLSADTMIDFLERNNQLLCLHLCPMPRQCLPLVATSTTTAINRPGPFLGFIKQKMDERGEKPLRRPKKGADLQALINRLGKMPRLRTLWLGHVPYSSHFLQLASLGDMEEMRHLHLKDCNALDGNALKAILTGLRENLRQLSLLNCLQLEDFSSLAVCAFLIQLDVENAKALNNEALQGVAMHGRLKIVRINQCPRVSDAGIWSLAEKCPLKELELIKCPGISAELFANGQAFANCSKLERLSLSGCEAITNDSIGAAIKILPVEQLQQLDLSRNMNLDDSALERIKEGLERGARQNTKTLIVYCSGTGISRAEANPFEPLLELAFY